MEIRPTSHYDVKQQDPAKRSSGPPEHAVAKGYHQGPNANAAVPAHAAYASRTELNVSILKASAEVSLSSGNEPLHLLYRAAIEELNVTLEAELGPDAIQTAAQTPDDWTPEAVAGRIVEFATGLMGAFREKYAGLDEGSQNESFMHTIRSGIERGFEEAKSILDGLKVLQGDIAADIDRTWELVQQGLAEFEQGLKPKQEEEPAPPAPDQA